MAPDSAPGRPGSRRAKIIAAVAAVLVALVLCEVLLRLFWTPDVLASTPAFVHDPATGFAPAPGVSGERVTPEYRHTFRNNRQGLRAEREFTRLPPPGVRARILFVGDSFTYGVGNSNDGTFVERINAALPDVEVINAGCNAHGTRHSLGRLDYYGPALSPDLVVLVFFWNDVGDNIGRDGPTFALDPSGRVVRTSEAPQPADPLASRPVAATAGRSPWSVLFLHQVLRQATRSLRYRLLGRRAQPIQTEEQREEAWRVTEELLRLMQLRAGELGARFLVVSLPDHNQVDPAAVIKSITPFHFEVQERLGRVCARLGIDFLDLLEPLRQAWQKAGEDFYYYTDRHLTPRGNREVADLLLKELQRRVPAR